MSLSVETLAVARKYTDDSLAGAGAVAGVPCKIQSITAITGGNRVTFLWTDNNGDDHTSAMDVMNGVDGEDGKGIQSVSVNAENHLIITYTDGTTVDAGQIEIHSAVDSVNGQTGAVVLDAEDVGALPDDTPIPSKTSDLTNDSGFATTSDVSTALADYTTTADLTTLLAAKQDTLTFDNVPTKNSNNPVKSGGVYTANDKIYQVMGQNSSKNFIPFDLDRIKAYNTTGTWSGNVYSLNGIDFTFNSDGTVDASGTATETANVHYYDPVGLPPFGGDRILRLTGCPSGGSRTTYKVMAYRASEVDGSTGTAEDYGDGISLRWLNNGSGIKAFISISVYTEAGTIDVTFKPMLRLSTDTDNTFAPYAKTNRELTEDGPEISNLTATKNSSFLNGTDAVVFRKYGKMVNCEGYFQVTTAAARNDELYALSEKPKGDSFLFASTQNGAIVLLKVNTNSKVLVESANGIDTGFYGIVGSFMLV